MGKGSTLMTLALAAGTASGCAATTNTFDIAERDQSTHLKHYDIDELLISDRYVQGDDLVSRERAYRVISIPDNIDIILEGQKVDRAVFGNKMLVAYNNTFEARTADHNEVSERDETYALVNIADDEGNTVLNPTTELEEVRNVYGSRPFEESVERGKHGLAQTRRVAAETTDHGQVVIDDTIYFAKFADNTGIADNTLDIRFIRGDAIEVPTVERFYGNTITERALQGVTYVPVRVTLIHSPPVPESTEGLLQVDDETNIESTTGPLPVEK
jgi:hypothetical protein